ncbi:DEHA2B04730p [Debaryomyces hansenii CBS767]|jgi:cytochrome c oxidase subunit 6a|uniref:Cytochrome c oxidase subunit n=1 Tax=Debaryomyces hansenii (strain ATCC 36239 / CBS 767 / BCRC 21394 / JCM 1990 / NBRC 0083 / IGC 2968) TaxID=284592 RepID=Q6BXA1_DEBHA|nr:DEHA2B04730p [Debaryomyces hansenii CBS767]CAG85163.1 DEHA2B04730p [Debaryomyces hansenii CBS767]|eukprot:XP_457168.1 DEHA2B04730p [Debaryomyces hansenii CBS767]
MFRSVGQRTFVRFNSSGHHGYGVSKRIAENAFPKVDKQAGEAFKKASREKAEHSEGITKLWKKITYVVALPVVLLTAIPIARIEMHHAEHRKHLREVPDEEWPTQYEYQNLRQKKFFWGDGDKTLFWNSDVNRHIEA